VGLLIVYFPGIFGQVIGCQDRLQNNVGRWGVKLYSLIVYRVRLDCLFVLRPFFPGKSCRAATRNERCALR